MSNLDFPVKAEEVSILNFPDCRMTEIHASGCKHEGKAKSVRPVAADRVPSPNDGYGDDWYHVAPCARKAS